MQAMTSDDIPKFRSVKMRTSKIAPRGRRRLCSDEHRDSDDRRGRGPANVQRLRTSPADCRDRSTYCRPAMPMAMKPKPNQSMRRSRRLESGTNCDARNNESSPTGRLM